MKTRAVLSQGEPRDASATVNFDNIEFYNSIMPFNSLPHNGFLVHIIYRWNANITVTEYPGFHGRDAKSQWWQKITAQDQNHSKRPRWSWIRDYFPALRNVTTTGHGADRVLRNQWTYYVHWFRSTRSARDLCPWLTVSEVTTHNTYL